MPRPRKNEKKQHFISRYIKQRQHEHPKESVKRSTAIAYSEWRKHKKRKK